MIDKPMIFDSHCHYDDNAFDSDRQTLIPQLFSKSVDKMMHASTDINSAKFGIETAGKFDNFYTSVGLHPENLDGLCKDNIDDYLKNLFSLCNHKKVKAIGEIGLDYHYEGFNREFQMLVFEKQLQIAKDLSLPVIVHSRNATEDTMNILKHYQPKGVMHCFGGSADTANEIANLGMYIGFTGVLTFKNAKKAHKACIAMPIDRLLVETDCPYMAPEPFRGTRCDSSMIEKTAEAMAKDKQTTLQDILKITNENACRLFDI